MMSHRCFWLAAAALCRLTVAVPCTAGDPPARPNVLYPMRNVAAEPAYANTLKELDDRLMSELTASGDPRAAGKGDAFEQLNDSRPKMPPARPEPRLKRDAAYWRGERETSPGPFLCVAAGGDGRDRGLRPLAGLLRHAAVRARRHPPVRRQDRP